MTLSSQRDDDFAFSEEAGFSTIVPLSFTRPNPVMTTWGS
jgi:hypothetical protein